MATTIIEQVNEARRRPVSFQLYPTNYADNPLYCWLFCWAYGAAPRIAARAAYVTGVAGPTRTGGPVTT